MTQLHYQEKEQFKKLFKENLLDSFEDRCRILEVFLETEEHVTASELTALLREKHLRFETDFVKDTLDFMCRFGFAQKNTFEDGKLRYEHRHLGDHHDHMICTKCQSVFEFHDEQLEKRQIEIASSRGFHMLQHKLEIYGICKACLEDRRQLMPLVNARPGEHLQIKGLTGGRGMHIRLLNMGLRINDRITVITNDDRGQLVVASDQKRFVLGRKIASKILAQLE